MFGLMEASARRRAAGVGHSAPKRPAGSAPARTWWRKCAASLRVCLPSSQAGRLHEPPRLRLPGHSGGHCHPANAASRPLTLARPAASGKNSAEHAFRKRLLGQFPDGVYRTLATNRLAELRAAAGYADPRRPAEPGAVFRDCPGCPEMVVVPPDRFRMGCVSGRNCDERELPVHDVSLASYALSAYEVTFEEYDRFARDTGRRRPRRSGLGP